MATSEFQSVLNQIEKYEFISLDIFDTLIYRLTPHPTDIFDIVEQVAAKRIGTRFDGFRELRVRAESKARATAASQNSFEITTDEIYRELAQALDLSVPQREALFAIEHEVEKQLIQLTEFGKTLLEFFREHPNKRVVLTSDMYLDIAFIKDLLSKCGIDFHEHVLLSSELNATKHEGRLYNAVVEHFGCKPSEILHIGDNLEVDKIRAVAMGIHGYHIPAPRSIFDEEGIWTDTRLFPARSGLGYLVNAQFVNKLGLVGYPIWREDIQTQRDVYLHALGYLVLAPLLFSLCFWLKNVLVNNEAKRVNFLARDGLLAKRAFDDIFPDVFETDYVAASRRMLTLPFSILSERELRNFHVHSYENAKTLGDIVDGFPKNEILKARLEELGVKFETKVNKQNIHQLHQIIFENVGLINLGLQDEKQQVTDYLTKKFPDGQTTVLFDLGWRGSLQAAVHKALSEKGPEVIGAYFGTTNEATAKLSAKGHSYSSYAMHDSFPEDQRHYCQTYTDVLEFLFSADHPSISSVVGKGTTDFTWEFQDCSDREKDTQAIASQIQNAALEAITDILELVDVDLLEEIDERSVVIEDFFSFVDNPDSLCAKHLDEVYIFSGIGDQSGIKLIDSGPPDWVVKRQVQSRWQSAFYKGISRADHRVLAFLNWCYNHFYPVKFIYHRFLAK